MESWQWTAILLCCFGFFKELRPSEPFVTKYLIDYKGFSKETIVHVAYPIATYTYFGALPVIFLITDFLRYKSIVILEGLSFVAVFGMLAWTNGLTALKIIEVLYGIAGATEVAYYTYIYAKVDKVHYKKVTSYTYSSVFFGNFIAAVISQILVSFDLMNYHQLNFVSLGGVSIALAIALFLPSVRQSIYFYRREFELSKPIDPTSNDSIIVEEDPNCNNVNVSSSITISKNDEEITKTNNSSSNLSIRDRVRKAGPILWTHFKHAYSNSYVLKWSIWWAIATAGHLQITNYYQSLWEEIEPESEDGAWNAAVSAVQSALSALFAFGIGHVRISWSKWGESFLCLISIIQGLDLVWFSQTNSLITGYVLLVVYRTLYQILITVASAEVAHGIHQDSYGLIFGINTFAAVCIQTILTLIINEEGGLQLDIRPQFLVYGVYYGVLGAAFLIVSIISICRRNSSKSTNIKIGN